MNDNAKKLYYYLLTGPEDFDMRDCTKCVLGMIGRLDPSTTRLRVAGYRSVSSYRAAEWLELAYHQTDGLFFDWPQTGHRGMGPRGAIAKAGELRLLYPQEVADVPER